MKPRPITGIHYGGATNAGFSFEGYKYWQTDILFDWHSGTFYKVKTVGRGVYVGTPNGLGGEGYAGITHVYNIPKGSSTNDVVGLLEGDNIDFEAAIAFDAGIEAGGSAGLSLDLDPNGGFQYTTSGQMYSTERSYELGIGLIPTELDLGLQAGISNSTADILLQLPWWP